MKTIMNDDFDCMLLVLAKKYTEVVENKWEKHYFKPGFFMEIPDDFQPTEPEAARRIFRSEKRPSIIFLSADQMAGFTFQIIYGEGDSESLGKKRERVRDALYQRDERTVFYEHGEEGKAVWQEYKSFATDERVYNLLFLFPVEQEIVLGTFFCVFERYEYWKPIAFSMLSTIREEKKDEGISCDNQPINISGSS